MGLSFLVDVLDTVELLEKEKVQELLSWQKGNFGFWQSPE